jgi:hypothetical protein
VLRFHARIFWAALTRSPGPADLFAGLLSAVIAFVFTRLVPQPADVVTDLVWQIPLGTLSGVFLARWLVIEPYRLYMAAEKGNRRLRERLELRERRRRIAEGLAERLAAGEALFVQPVKGDTELAQWHAALNRWYTETHAWIRENLAPATATLFQSMTGGLPLNFGHAYNDTHNGLLRRHHRLLANLRSILEDTARDAP